MKNTPIVSRLQRLARFYLHGSGYYETKNPVRRVGIVLFLLLVVVLMIGIVANFVYQMYQHPILMTGLVLGTGLFYLGFAWLFAPELLKEAQGLLKRHIANRV